MEDINWDVIMFNHSFEHMPDPFVCLKKVHSLLKHEGTCIIRIPTASSWAWRHYRSDWVQLDAPRHFFLYTENALRLLATRTGFEVMSVRDESTAFQFMGSEQYKMGIPLVDPKSWYGGNANAFSKEEIVAYEKKAMELNKIRDGDSISVLLKKVMS